MRNGLDREDVDRDETVRELRLDPERIAVEERWSGVHEKLAMARESLPCRDNAIPWIPIQA
jgi:hypothetical protein